MQKIAIIILYIIIVLLLYFLTNIKEGFQDDTPNIIQSIKIIDITSDILKKIDGKDVKFYSSNASIIEVPYENVYALNIRFVNYKITGDTYHKDEKSNISINKLLYLDSEFKITDYDLFDINLDTSLSVIGLEDIRLYNDNGLLYYSASYYNTDCNCMKISNNRYNITSNGLDLVPNIIKVDFDTNYTTEKNWLYFKYLNETHVIYSWYPLKICKIINNNLVLIKTIKTPKIFKNFSGSSCGISNENNIWFIVHYRKEITKYYHYFVCFDTNMNLVKYSKPFVFESIGIEYCLSFIIKDSNIVIPYTINDSKLKLGIYNKEYIFNNIDYIHV